MPGHRHPPAVHCNRARLNVAVGRVFAFDWGLKRIGVAVGNGVLGTCEPLCILKARDGVPNWEEIAKLLTEWQPEQILVGDPINMDGSEGDITLRARRFSRQLSGRFNLPVKLVDERLSTREARLRRGDQGQQDPADAHAAQVILESWLSESTEN